MNDYMTKLQKLFMELYEVTKTTNRDAIDAKFDYTNGYIQAWFEMNGEESFERVPFEFDENGNLKVTTRENIK